MRQAKLPNGQILVFPENTSDKVIQATVDRITNTKTEAEWSNEHVKAIVREITAAQGAADMERAQIDHFGPAIEKQTKEFDKLNKGLTKSVQDFVSGIVKSEKDKNETALNKIRPVVQEISKQIVYMTNKIESLVLHNSRKEYENTHYIVKAMEANTKAVNDLRAAQLESNRVLRELVDATKSGKTIMRDKQGNIVGVKNA